MDGFVVLGLLLILMVLVGSLLGIVSFVEIRSLRDQVHKLNAGLEGVQAHPGKDSVAPSHTSPARESADRVSSHQASMPSAQASQSEALHSPKMAPRAQVQPRVRPEVSGRLPSKRSPAIAQFWESLRHSWMIWLGGACVALAGVFLARYGIEEGLLGPKVRVVLGLVTALALYLASELLRRKTGASHPTFAALAGGGAITAFAAILSAVHLYHLMAPGLAFGLLALVALVTMWMARLHGPVLAAIGMLGAYALPALVATGDGNILGAMAYALIITASVLLLLRYVVRTWLWLGLLAGALVWWMISMFGHEADGWRGVYLAVLGYLLLAVTSGDWLLRGVGVASSPEESKGTPGTRGNRVDPANKVAPLILPGLLVLVVAQCVSILREGFQPDAIWVWYPLAVVTLIAAGSRAHLAMVPWALLLGQFAAWLGSQMRFAEGQVSLSRLPAPEQGSFLLYLGVSAVIFSGLALLNYRRGLFQNRQRLIQNRQGLLNIEPAASLYWWSSLAVMGPLLFLLLGYLLAAGYLSLYWWCLFAAVFGAVFMYLGSRGAGRGWPKAMEVWLFAAAHFAYSLAICLWLDKASLTLALALQSVSLAWIIRRFEIPALGWLLKVVLLLVVVRLTFNPWLLAYTDSSHWSLWTYGGSALCAWFAARVLSPGFAPLARWAEAAALHLLVLALWAECRYWLYGGNAFAAAFSFTEAVIDMWLFCGLGLVYYRKSLVAGNFSRWYKGYSQLLVFAALGIYARLLVALAESQPWVWESIGSRPLFNMLLPAFAGPALLAFVVSRYYLPGCRKFATLLAALASFVWVSLEVRHLWQGTIRMDLAPATGELYSYSAVWLLMAVAAILLGSWKHWRSCYQGGMAVLAVVIVKLFLVDMSGLEGLLRVASFMGMGLALLGIAYLHQKLGAGAPKAEPVENSSSIG